MKFVIEVSDGAAEDMKTLFWEAENNTIWIKDWCRAAVVIEDIKPYDPPRLKCCEATPQDSYDHLFGSGAFTFNWWRDESSTGVNSEGEVEDDWSVELSCEDGDEDEGAPYIKATVTHESILALARDLLENPREFVSDTVLEQCANLLYNKDNLDFDANSSDTFLQLLVLGKVVFG